MKNTSSPEDSIFRKKGFFIALYSCLGVVAALALVVTFVNRNQDPSQEIAYYEQEAILAGADQVDSYLAAAEEEAWFRPRQQPTPTTPPPALPTPPPQPTQQITPQPEAQYEPSDDVETEAESEADTEADDATSPTPPAQAEPTAQEGAAYFTAFTEDDRMVWPVYGEIVMPFSMTRLIRDATLDQYRVNDHVRISAEEGDPVRAAAEGRVLATGRDSRRGHYITIDHGNGWVTTYGQLMETPLVSEGEVVRSGQVIGGVGRQTKFASLDGTHVHLRVMRDNEPVNPYEWLSAVND